VQVISIRLNKANIHYVKHNNFNYTKLMIIFTRNTHFYELRNTVYLCHLQPNFGSECKELTRINLLRCNTRFHKKKNFVFLHTSPVKYDTQTFHKETCLWFQFVWTSTTFSTSNTMIWTPKLKILLFTRNPHFISCETLCNFVVYNQTVIRNSKSLQEWIYCVVTHTILQEKISFIYIQNRWNMILRPFIREMCYWFQFVWTSPTFTTSNSDFNGAKLMILTFIRKTHFHELRNTV
jgi:hypothetical protein